MEKASSYDIDIVISKKKQGMCFVQNTGIALIKVWEDESFFELNFAVRSKCCTSDIKFYSSNIELDELLQGLLLIASMSENEYIWTSGEDKENTTHYVYVRAYIHGKRGHVGFEIILDNKLSPPDKMRSLSFVIAELNQLDHFIQQLQELIEGKSIIVKGEFN